MLNVSVVDLNDADDAEEKDVNVMMIMMMIKTVVIIIIVLMIVMMAMAITTWNMITTRDSDPEPWWQCKRYKSRGCKRCKFGGCKRYNDPSNAPWSRLTIVNLASCLGFCMRGVSPKCSEHWKTLHLDYLKECVNVITFPMFISPNLHRSSNASSFQKTALHSLAQDNL